MQKQNNSVYLIRSELSKGQLKINLDILDSQTGTKVIKCFGKTYNESSLPEQVKKNFKDIQNVNSILNQSPQTCKVNIEIGILTLVYNVVFPNGNKFQLLGNLQLQQKQVPPPTKTDQQLNKKIKKIQQDVEKIYKLMEQNYQEKYQQIDGVLKDINKEVQELKRSFEDHQIWKKQYEKKYREIVLLYHTESHKEKQMQQKAVNVGIPDQMMHMFDRKVDELRQVFSDKLQKQAQKVEDLKDSSSRHQKIIDRLTQQNIELKKMLKTLEQKSSITNEKHETLEGHITQLKTKSQRLIKRLSSHQQQLQQVKSQMSSPSPKKQQHSQEHIDPLLNFFFNPNLPKKPSQNPMQSPKSQDKTILVQQMQIHPQSGYSKQFVNNGRAIAYNGVTEQPTQLFGKLKISTQRVSFLTILKTKNSQIGFGIMDQKHLQQRNSIKRQNCILLNASNGALYDGGSFVSTNGDGFKQGDKVKMRVNSVEGFVQWAVDGVVVCKHKSYKLKNEEIEWFPFIRLCDRGDTVKWTLE